jgi:hypothetical protein
MAKIEEMAKSFDRKEDTMAIYFGDDGVAVAGNCTKFQQIEALLALVSSIVERNDGDATVVNEALKALKDYEKKQIESLKEEDEALDKLLNLLKEKMEKEFAEPKKDSKK